MPDINKYRQMMAMLHKNILLKRRNGFSLVFELGFPVLFGYFVYKIGVASRCEN